MGRWNYNYYVYLMTNRYNTVVYTGMTNDLIARGWQHKSKTIPGFTSRYNITKLVYYEYFDHVEDAIRREKQIKTWPRARKEQLIEAMNPGWRDLYSDIIGDQSKRE